MRVAKNKAAAERAVVENKKGYRTLLWKCCKNLDANDKIETAKDTLFTGQGLLGHDPKNIRERDVRTKRIMETATVSTVSAQDAP